MMFWNIQPKIWKKQVQVKEQFYKGGFLWNNYSKGEQYKIKKEHFISQKEQIGILRIMFWNIQPKIWNKQVQVKEQFCKGGFLWNNYSKEEQHKIGTNRNIKNNVMEYLASNLEQTGKLQ